jgi:membrane protein implicated in regulation of membrane protease activity
MGELISYTIRLVIVAILGAVVFLVVGAASLLIVGMIVGAGTESLGDSLGIGVGLIAFAAALYAVRFFWARWLRPQDSELSYLRRVADAASEGLTLPDDNENRARVLRASASGFVLAAPNRQLEINWSDLREIRIQTLRSMLAGPYFLLIKNDGETVRVAQDEMTPGVIAQMQQLPDFRNDALIEAMGSTTDAEFSCWRRRM